MSIASIDQSKFHDPNACSNGGSGDGSMAFSNAIKTPRHPPVLIRQLDDLSSPNRAPASFLAFGAVAPSALFDSGAAVGDDDDVKRLDATSQSSLSQVKTIVNNELAALPANGSADSNGPSVTSPPGYPADYLTALQNGTASGNPPDDLTLPPGTTAADVAGMNGGLLNNLNDLHIQDGTPAGDAAAQKYGYKDMKTLLADTSPQAAAAAGKILWAARACNNMTEADGAARPADEQNANTLSGITSHHEADNGSTSGAFQNWLKGTSIQSQTVFATSRTHADGQGMSNAEIIGNKIAGVFKKIFSFICPPISDLIQMAQDGAEKIRDDHVGDKDAASHDSAKIKQDGKNFGTDFAEFAVNAALMVVPGAGEVGMAAKGAEEAAETGAKVGAEDGAKAASKAAGSDGKDAASAARDIKPAAAMPDASSLADGLKNLIFGDDFKSKLTGLPKHATRKQKEDYVNEKVQDHMNDLVQQLVPPQNGNRKTPQNGGSASEREELLALLTELLSTLENALASGSGAMPGSGYIGNPWRQRDLNGPAAPVSRTMTQHPAEAVS
jgi:hypothetical protein